jgi:hypothetical protein
VLTRHVLWALSDQPAAVSRWAGLLRLAGRFVLIEGTWSTGTGIASDAVVTLLKPYAATTDVIPLDDPNLWGKPITDDRYAVIAQT